MLVYIHERIRKHSIKKQSEYPFSSVIGDKEIKMTSAILKDKVIREINLIPQEKLSEVYSFIHYFRIGAEKEKNKVVEKPLLSYAGIWGDMKDEVFDDFFSEIEKRREGAFSKRRKNEADID